MRDSESVPVTNFYTAFREWINTNFQTVNDVIWSELLEEDENVDYSVTGNGRIYEETVVNDGETDIPPENNSIEDQ